MNEMEQDRVDTVWPSFHETECKGVVFTSVLGIQPLGKHGQIIVLE